MSSRGNPLRQKPCARSIVGTADPLFDALFEDANDIIVVNDRDGVIVAANRMAREFGGYALEDVERGVTLRELLPPAEYEAAMVVTERALAGLPIPEAYEREVQLRDGSRRVLELRSNVLPQEAQPALLQTIGRDITERKDAVAFRGSLLQVAQALLTVQSLDELGTTICQEARRVLEADGVYLWLRRGEDLIGCAAAGFGAELFAGTRLPFGQDLVDEVDRTTGVVLLNDFPQSRYMNEVARAAGLQSAMVLPLRHEPRAIGLLVFADYSNPQRFTPALGDRAMIFGAQAGVAIESALAREREEDEGRVSASLLRVTRAIRESLQEAEVPPQIARSTREALDCDWSAVSLWYPVKEAFRLTAVDGWPSELAQEVQSLEFGIDSLPVVGRLLARETVELTEPRGRREALYRRWQISSMLLVPMHRAGRVVGALIVGYRERRGPFSQRERRIAEGIAAQAAVAVENARLVEALRRANQLKSEFLGTMSHELRTPLGAMLGYTELLREGAIGPTTDEQIEVLDRILLNGRGLLELINMTLDVSRLEAGRITIDVSEFSIEALLTELRNEFSIARRPEVELRWPAEVAAPGLCLDRGKLKLVLRNLIDNALKFTRRGSVTVKVETDRERDRVRVSVADTGVGIPPEAVPSIFEMFRQLDGARSSRAGVGLGLYLVRRYTELMGGTVAVESTVGVGSVFTADLPRRVDQRA